MALSPFGSRCLQEDVAVVITAGVVSGLLAAGIVGNLGKPVTLETSRLMKFVMQVFRSKELAKIWNLELMKSRSHERAVVWNPELSKPRSRERAMAWNLEPAKSRSREFVKTQSHEPADPRTSGICEIREYDGERVQESRYVKIS
jgi:hypothetical protein